VGIKNNADCIRRRKAMETPRKIDVAGGGDHAGKKVFYCETCRSPQCEIGHRFGRGEQRASGSGIHRLTAGSH